MHRIRGIFKSVTWKSIWHHDGHQSHWQGVDFKEWQIVHNCERKNHFVGMPKSSFHHKTLYVIWNKPIHHILYGILQWRRTLQPAEKSKENEGRRCKVLFFINFSSHRISSLQGYPVPWSKTIKYNHRWIWTHSACRLWTIKNHQQWAHL